MKATMTQGLFSGPPQEHFRASEPLSVVGVCLDEETLRFLNVFSTSNPIIRLSSKTSVYHRAQDADSILEEFGIPAPDICLIDFDKDRRAAAMMAERVHAHLPGTAVFAVSSQSQPHALLEAMRCGCSEYLIKPIDREQLTSAVIRVSGRRKEKHDQNRGQLLAFIGAKGGCGVTTLATQLGAMLTSSFSRSALLVDFHPDFGDAALYLRLNKPRYHFFELLENTDRLDNDFLESFLMKHSSGLELIPAPEGSFSTRDGLPTGALANTLDFLRLRYEFILVDLPPALNEDNLSVIRDCDQLYLVTVAEVAAFPLVVPKAGHTRDALDTLFYDRKLKPNLAMELDSSDLLKRFPRFGPIAGIEIPGSREDDSRRRSGGPALQL